MTGIMVVVVAVMVDVEAVEEATEEEADGDYSYWVTKAEGHQAGIRLAIQLGRCFWRNSHMRHDSEALDWFSLFTYTNSYSESTNYGLYKLPTYNRS